MKRTWSTDYPDNRLVVDGVDLSDTYRMILIDGYTLSPPEPKIYTVDIPGGDGVIDLTDAIIGDTVYNNRSQVFTFYILDQQNQQDFEATKTLVSNFLHGKAFDYYFTMDPEYTYHGRFQVTNYEHEAINTGILGSIEITVDANPYKSKGTMGYTLDAVGGKEFHLSSGRRRVNPTIECTEPCTVAFRDDDEVSLSAGTWKLNTVVFEEGDNEIYINSHKLYYLRWDDVGEDGEYPLLWTAPYVTSTDIYYSVTPADDPWPLFVTKDDDGYSVDLTDNWSDEIPLEYTETDGVGSWTADMSVISNWCSESDIEAAGGFILWTMTYSTYSNSVNTSSYDATLYVSDGSGNYIELEDDPTLADDSADGVTIAATYYYASSDRTLVNEDAFIDAYDIPHVLIDGSEYYKLDEDNVQEYDLIGSWWDYPPTGWGTKGVYDWTRVIKYYTDGVWTRYYVVETNYTVLSTATHYMASTQGIDVPSGTWSTTDPRSYASGTDYPFVWTRYTIVDSNGETFYSYEVDYTYAVDGDPLTYEETTSYLMVAWSIYKDDPEAVLSILNDLVVLQDSDSENVLDSDDDIIQVYFSTNDSWTEYDETLSETYGYSYIVLEYRTVNYSDGVETYSITLTPVFEDDDLWTLMSQQEYILGYSQGDSTTDMAALLDSEDWIELKDDSSDEADVRAAYDYIWTKIISTYESPDGTETVSLITTIASERTDYDEIMKSIRLETVEYGYQISLSGTTWTQADECAYSWVITEYAYTDYPDIFTYDMVVTYNALSQAASSYRWDTVHSLYGGVTTADFSKWEDAASYTWDEISGLGYSWEDLVPSVVTYFQYEWEDL